MNVHEAGCLLRGKVINDVIVIERLIDDFIAQHYCKSDKRLEFLEFFISQDGIAFDRKKGNFKFILKNNYSELYEKHSDVFPKIVYLIQERNILAHHLLDNTPQAEEDYKTKKKITFLRFKNGKNHEVYDEIRINKIRDTMSVVIKTLQSFYQD